MSNELIKQKIIEHLKLYGFEYACFTDENGNLVKCVDEDGTLSFFVPGKFYSINEFEINNYSDGDYELHIQDSCSGGRIRIVVYWTSIVMEYTDQYIECIEYIDFIEEIPFAINKVLAAIAHSRFKVELQNVMCDIDHIVNNANKSKEANTKFQWTALIKDKLKPFLN
jgi:hypothetical protein